MCCSSGASGAGSAHDREADRGLCHGHFRHLLHCGAEPGRHMSWQGLSLFVCRFCLRTDLVFNQSCSLRAMPVSLPNASTRGSRRSFGCAAQQAIAFLEYACCLKYLRDMLSTTRNHTCFSSSALSLAAFVHASQALVVGLAHLHYCCEVLSRWHEEDLCGAMSHPLIALHESDLSCSLEGASQQLCIVRHVHNQRLPMQFCV